MLLIWQQNQINWIIMKDTDILVKMNHNRYYVGHKPHLFLNHCQILNGIIVVKFGCDALMQLKCRVTNVAINNDGCCN